MLNLLNYTQNVKKKSPEEVSEILSRYLRTRGYLGPYDHELNGYKHPINRALSELTRHDRCSAVCDCDRKFDSYRYLIWTEPNTSTILREAGYGYIGWCCYCYMNQYGYEARPERESTILCGTLLT